MTPAAHTSWPSTGASSTDPAGTGPSAVRVQRARGQQRVERPGQQLDRPAADRPAREPRTARGLHPPEGHQPAGPIVIVCVVV